MKKSITVALVALAGGLYASTDADVFPHCQKWGFRAEQAPVEAFDPTDISEIMHGPWLTMPREDSMRVTWISRSISGGGIAYREKGTEAWRGLWDVKYGLIDASTDVHSVELTGLKPGTEYEYCVVAANCEKGYGYLGVYTNKTVATFRTLDPKRTNYRVFLTSDSHGCANMNFEFMYAKTGAAEADCYFFLGDIVNDGVYNDIRFYITKGFLDDITRLWGRSKPSVFMRGNHDLNGRDHYKWGQYFPQSDGKTYQAFRQGPALFVALDTMYDCNTPQAQGRQHVAYLREQADWLKGLKRTEMWKGASFRIVMGHIAPWPILSEAKNINAAFSDVLADETPEGRIHALVTGHEHTYYRLNPNGKVLRLSNKYGDVDLKTYPKKWYKASAIPARFPYVNLILHAHEAMTVDVSPEKLVFKSHRWHKAAGGLYDAFELLPDGTVNEILPDIVEVPVK